MIEPQKHALTEVSEGIGAGRHSPPQPEPTAGPASARRHAANIALIAAMVVAMFWRVFFFGETLIDTRVLNNQLPWGYYAGQSSDHPYNRLDPTDMYVTRDYFVVASYGEGETPLWNPYTMAGHPIYADGVTRTLSPFLLFYTFLDVPLGYSVARVTELLLAAVFMYLFLVSIGARPRGALMGSVVLAFSAHSMFHLTGLGWWGGAMWLPLILLFADRAVKRMSFASAILAGVFLAAQFFCAYIPNQIYYVGTVIVYYLFAGLTLSVKGRRLRVAAMMAVTLAAGFGLAATQWMPVMELLRHSNRYVVPTEISYIYLPPWYLATMILPNLFGTSYDVRTLSLFTAINVSHDHILYIGIAALAPLVFCLYSLRRGWRTFDNRRVLFFAGLAVLALAAMTAAPLYVHVTKFIPVLQTIRVIVRAGVLFMFAVSVLIAFGTDMLLKADQQDLKRAFRFSKKALFLVGGFILTTAAVAYAMKLSGFTADPAGRGAAAFARKAVLALAEQFTPPNAAILIPLAFLCAVVLLLKWFASSRVTPGVFYASLAALLLVDLFWYGTYLNPTFDRAQVFPRTQITDFLRSLPPGRVLVTPSDLLSNRRVSREAQAEKIIAPPNTLLPYGVSTVTGKDQLFPRWYREFSSLVEPQPYLSHVVFDAMQSRYFDLLNVRYVLTHESRQAPEGYERLASGEGLSVYENKAALPRAFFARKIIVADNSAEALKLIGDSEFDPRTTAVIELSNLKSRTSNGADGIATIKRDRRNGVEIEAESAAGGLMVLADNYYPGWRAYVDGEPVEVLRANHTMRAVEVPAGRHSVAFVFEPPILTASLYITAAAALVVGLALAALWRRVPVRSTTR